MYFELLAMSVLAAATLPFHQQIRTTHNAPDSRRMAAIILDQAQPDDGLVFGGSAWTLRPTLSHYLNQQRQADQHIPRDVLLVRTAAEVGQLNAEECPAIRRCLEGTSRVWLATSVPPDGTAPLSNGKPKMNELNACFQVARTWQISPGQLTLLVRRPSCAGSAM